MRGATFGCDFMVNFELFQSTHPCGVRRMTREAVGALVVSIHAPVRGATRKASLAELVAKVSIHAPVRGATPHRLSCALLQLGFNPRTRAGCDVNYKPIKGKARQFQSTHPCGVRHKSHNALSSIIVFQSTHPCGVRLCFDKSLNFKCFQILFLRTLVFLL